MISSISNRTDFNNTTQKQQTSQKKQVAFSATPAEIATLRFYRLPDMPSKRPLCFNGDHVLAVLLKPIFAVGAALKPGETFNLINRENNPKGPVFKFLDRLLDSKYGQNPYNTLRKGLLKQLEEHNQLEPDAVKLLKAPKINNIFAIEPHKPDEPSTLTGFLKKLEDDKKLLPEDHDTVQLLEGRDFPNIPDKRVFRIPH